MLIRINFVILTGSNTLLNDCFSSIIYVVQGFHKLEINSFSSSSFSCIFMWGNIWSLIWVFLWKSTNLRCFNCLLAVSFVFTKFISTLLSVFWLLTTECKNPSKLKCRLVVSFVLARPILFVPPFFLLLISNHRKVFSTVLLRHQLTNIEQIYEFIQEFWEKNFW